MLDGINARLQDEPGIEVVGQASNGREALEVAEQVAPDLVLMDLTMPVMGGLEATRCFKQKQPAVRVLILSMHDNQEYILKVMQSGASGYVLKDVSSSELIKAIETVYEGKTYFSSSASETLSDRSGTVPPLTDREQTVLTLISAGQCNKVVARQLDISVRTVETHRLNIKKKLGVQTTAGLIKYAFEQGLVQIS